MIKAALKTPKYWLSPKDCASMYAAFRKILEFGEPIPLFEERFPGRLEGILGSVAATWDKKYLNATVLDGAAAYFNQIVRGHPFGNGNKRMAVLFTHYFLLMNGLDFTLSPQEMYNFAVQVALTGRKRRGEDGTKEWCKQVIGDFVVEGSSGFEWLNSLVKWVRASKSTRKN
jgi:death-on-curing protein